MDSMGLELREQGEVWGRLWRRRGEVEDLLAAACPRAPRQVLFTGCGDCHAAAEYGEWLLGWRSELPTRGLPAMELSRARAHLLGPGTFLVALSVSGRTPRVLEAVATALRRGAAAVAVTDDPCGPLAQLVPHAFCLGTAPPEALASTDYRDPEAARYAGYARPVPQTMTFGAMQLAVALACLSLERFAPSGRGPARPRVESELASLAKLAARARDAGAAAAAHLAARVRRRGSLAFCGTGPNAATARFASYKLLELACPCAFADIEEFCHTHYLVTGPGDAAVFLAQDAGGQARADEIGPVLREVVGAEAASLTSLPDRGPDRLGEFSAGPISLEVSPLLLGHAAAQLVRDLARSWGVDTDRFRAGVDEERYVRGSTRMIRDSAVLCG